MSVARWAAHSKQWKERRRREDYRSGLLAHILLKVNAGKRSRRVPKPLEFFEGKGGGESSEPENGEGGREAFFAWVKARCPNVLIVSGVKGNGRQSS